MNKSRKRALSLALALCLTLGMFTGMTLTAGAAPPTTNTPPPTTIADKTLVNEFGNNPGNVTGNMGEGEDKIINKDAANTKITANDAGKVIAFGYNTFTVKFDSQDGSTVSDVKVSKETTISSSSISAPNPAPTKSGYVFAGWYKEPACTNPWDFTKDKATGDMTLYAKWKLAIEIQPDPVTLYSAGDTHTAIVCFPSGYTGSQEGTWTTADKLIATVSANDKGDGVVKGVKVGETTLIFTHTLTGDTAFATVIVKSDASDSNKDNIKSTKNSTSSTSSNNSNINNSGGGNTTPKINGQTSGTDNLSFVYNMPGGSNVFTATYTITNATSVVLTGDASGSFDAATGTLTINGLTPGNSGTWTLTATDDEGNTATLTINVSVTL